MRYCYLSSFFPNLLIFSNLILFQHIFPFFIDPFIKNRQYSSIHLYLLFIPFFLSCMLHTETFSSLLLLTFIDFTIHTLYLLFNAHSSNNISHEFIQYILFPSLFLFLPLLIFLYQYHLSHYFPNHTNTLIHPSIHPNKQTNKQTNK